MPHRDGLPRATPDVKDVPLVRGSQQCGFPLLGSFRLLAVALQPATFVVWCVLPGTPLGRTNRYRCLYRRTTLRAASHRNRRSGREDRPQSGFVRVLEVCLDALSGNQHIIFLGKRKMFS